MKRIMKTCGALVLAASLMLGITGGYTPSLAADTTMTLEEFGSLYATVKTATQAIAGTFSTKTDMEMELSVPLIGSQKSTLSEILDPVNHASKATRTSGGIASLETYTDLAKGYSYFYSATNKRYEMSQSSSSVSALSALDALDFTKLGDVTITKGSGKKIGENDCQDVSVAFKLEGEKLTTVINDIYKAFGSMLNNATTGSSLGDLDIKSALKGVDLKITIYADDKFILRGTDITGSVSIDLFGSTLNIPLTVSAVSDVTTETVTIPADMVKSAQLITGVVVSKSGAKFKSTLSGSKTVFTVTGVTKTSAKKLTIPASISKLGKKYSVTKAAKNAFKKAKKLKTLVIKNKTLKKAVKKSRKTYGLSTKVKIK